MLAPMSLLSLFLPCAAVRSANDRPPKSRANPPAPQPGQQQRALQQQDEEEVRSRTIDAEP